MLGFTSRAACGAPVRIAYTPPAMSKRTTAIRRARRHCAERCALSGQASAQIDLASLTEAYRYLLSGAGVARTSVESSGVGAIVASDDDGGAAS